jgi:hypothetical protein
VAAQLSPPGLGPAKTATWTAIGLRQDLDDRDRWESMTYVGVGTVSPLNQRNAFARPAILVLNQEFYDQFKKQWVYSFALSYRYQHRYQKSAPYEAESPPTQQEFRLYGRYSHVLALHSFKLTNTFRPELRTFFGPGLGPGTEVLQFRFRLRTQLAWTIDNPGVHRLVTSAEALFAVRKERDVGWGDFAYTESRFCLYWSINSKHMPIIVDIGYMNDLVGTGSSRFDAHYVAFDMVWENPFGSRKRKAELPIEYQQ